MAVSINRMPAPPSRIPQRAARSSVTARTATALERWRVDVADAAVATLVIPADAQRERRFEISCSMAVRALPAGADGAAAWHQLTVTADGSRQWQRRVGSHLGGGGDGLDYRFERSVPAGRALRLSAEAACSGARRERLLIEAEEVD